jgi:hypothetical protein
MANGEPGAAHALPLCDRFRELEMTAFLIWLHDARLSSLAPAGDPEARARACRREACIMTEAAIKDLCRAYGWDGADLERWLRRRLGGRTGNVQPGERFGRLMVVRLTGTTDAKGHALAVCRCDCLETCVKPSSALRSGRIRSCGCLQREFRTLSNDERAARACAGAAE